MLTCLIVPFTTFQPTFPFPRLNVAFGKLVVWMSVTTGLLIQLVQYYAHVPVHKMAAERTEHLYATSIPDATTIPKLPLCPEYPPNLSNVTTVTYIHCSKYWRGQIFKAMYSEIYWGKSFHIVVLFSWIILLHNTVVVEKKISKTLFFYITQRGIIPKTQVYRSHCHHDLYPFKHVQTLEHCLLQNQ